MLDTTNEEIVIGLLKAYFNSDEKKVKSPNDEQEWKHLASFINSHGLGPFFYEAVTKNRVDFNVPPEILRQWTILSRKTAVYNALLEHELSSVLAGLKELNVFPVLLKGLALYRLYDNILTRPSSDIDLFITRNEYKIVCEYLLKNGFDYGIAKDFRGTRQQYIELQENYSTEISFHKVLGSTVICIDLHWELDGIYDGSPLERLFPIDQYPWHQYVEPDKRDDLFFYTLKPEMQFIHLVAHFALHHQFQGAKWFLDVVLFIHTQGDNLDWEFIDYIVQEPDCRKIIGITLRLINNILGDQLQTLHNWQHFWNGHGLPGEFKYFQKRIFSEPSKTGQYLGNVLLPLSIKDKLKVLVYYLFNKEAISLWRTDDNSGRIITFLQPFYILMRIYQERKKQKAQPKEVDK